MGRRACVRRCRRRPSRTIIHRWRSGAVEIDGKQFSFFDQLVWPELATTPGLPATAAPIGLSETGLPIGVQIIGPYLEDRTPIAFAALIEREFGGFVPPPGYAD